MQSFDDPIPPVPLPPIGYHARSPRSKHGPPGRSAGFIAIALGRRSCRNCALMFGSKTLGA